LKNRLYGLEHVFQNNRNLINSTYRLSRISNITFRSHDALSNSVIVLEVDEVFGLPVGAFALHAFDKFFAQQSFRAQQQDNNNYYKGQSVFEGYRDETTGERFGDAQQQSADQRAGHAVEPA
jgi:hypothetical protein